MYTLKNILSIIVFLSMTFSQMAFVEKPSLTLVIEDKAFSLKYADDKSLESENGEIMEYSKGEEKEITKTIENTKITEVDTKKHRSEKKREHKKHESKKDTKSPTIILNGKSIVNLIVDDIYEDEGVKAVDNFDGNISSKVKMCIFDNDGYKVEKVCTTTPAAFTITYNVSDKEGNKATEGIRKVIVNNQGNTNWDLINGGFIKQEYKWIYYCDYTNNNEICKIEIDGTNRSELNKYDLREITVKGDWIYYIEKGELYKVKVDGTERIKLDNNVLNHIKIVDDWIYYLNSEGRPCRAGGTPIYSLFKINTDGMYKGKIINDNVNDFDTSDDWIYYSNWSNDGKLYKIKIDGTNKIKLDDLTTGINDSIEVDGDWIYYSRYSGVDCSLIHHKRTLLKIKIDGTGRQIIGVYKHPPVIKLIGERLVKLNVGDKYEDAGAEVINDIDRENLTSKIKTSIFDFTKHREVEVVDTTTPGAFTIIYNVSDLLGNVAEPVKREVIVDND